MGPETFSRRGSFGFTPGNRWDISDLVQERLTATVECQAFLGAVDPRRKAYLKPIVQPPIPEEGWHKGMYQALLHLWIRAAPYSPQVLSTIRAKPLSNRTELRKPLTWPTVIV